MADENALVPIEQKQVVFYDDELTAVMVQVDGCNEVYVPVRPICDFLGVSWASQRRRINRNPILIGEKCIVVVDTPGGKQEMLCLPARFIPLTVATLSSRRLKLDGEKLSRYHSDLYHELTNAFEAISMSKAERIRILAKEMAGEDDEDVIEALISEMALIQGVGIIPYVRVTNQAQQVYLARAEDGLCKIGISAKAKSRIQAMNRVRSDVVRLLHVIPADDAEEAERKLHRRFHDKRVRGEWFQLTQTDVHTICDYVAYRSGKFLGGIV